MLSNNSYFKFNLDYMSFYQLIGRQDNTNNRNAYQALRNYTATHQNPFFNMVDRALRGPDPVRDAETRTLLDQWLQRPRRDFFVDLSLQVPVCGSDACSPIPVPLRPPATFLWEVSPFQLKGGGSGLIENAGVDYLLPYWMARYYGVIGSGSRVQSAAAPGNAVAPGSLASLYSSGLAASAAQAGSLPLPLSLGGVTLTITDSAGAQRIAPLLYVSPGQINFLLPDNIAPGPATFTVERKRRAAKLHRRRATRRAGAIQYERDRLRSGRRSRRLGAGRQSATAISRSGLSMREQRLCPHAARSGDRSSDLCELLWDRNPQFRARGRDRYHRWNSPSGPLCRTRAEFRRPRPGQRRPAAPSPWKRRRECVDHS